MIVEYVSHIHLSYFQTSSLVLFLTIYFVAILWTFRKGSNIHHQKMASELLRDFQVKDGSNYEG